MILIFTPLMKRLYEYENLNCTLSNLTNVYHRFPPSLPFVVIDFFEKLYLAGFPLLQLFVTLFPFILRGNNPPLEVASTQAACISSDDFICPEPDPATVVPTASSSASTMEFLPLMLTSIYCAIGLVWAFCRLSVLYLRQK